MNILVIGSANADMVIKADKIPSLGETIVGNDFSVNAGGKGLNQAVAISKLGGKVSFLGIVGNDAFGAMLKNTLNEYKVDFSGKALDNVSTGVAVITVVGADNFIVLNEGANACMTPEFVEKNRELIENADYIVLQLEIPVATIVKICETAKGKAKIILNPAPYKELPDSVYKSTDYLIPNEHEAKDITGITLNSKENCIKAVEKLKSLGAANVIITLGDKGSVYSYNNDVVFHPAEKAVAVDTTSAGDSFIGALTVMLSGETPLPEAISFATKVSAITVSRKGAAKSIPFINEVL